MIRVKEILKFDGNAAVLVCDMFADEEIKSVIQSNIGIHYFFEVEKPKGCFSDPATRHIVLFGDDDFTNIKTICFV